MGDDIIKVNLGEGKLPVMAHSDIVSFTMGNMHFKDLVNTGEPLDLKTRVYGEMEFSVWSRQWESGLDTDYAGNYLYGYVGKGYLGAPDFYLKGAAGTAQLLSDKDYTKWKFSLEHGYYGDNIKDSQMIQDGIDALMNKVKRGDK